MRTFSGRSLWRRSAFFCYDWFAIAHSSVRAQNNTELVANPGNFVFRCVSLVKTRFGGIVPAPGAHDESTQKFLAEVAELVGSYVQEMEKLELREALRVREAFGGLCLTRS